MTPQWTDAGLARLLNDVKENGMDRELLELAAKAAGRSDLTEWAGCITDHDSTHYAGPALHAPGIGGQCQSWNPLTDDGDALRLAVKLGIEVGVYARISKCAATTPGAAFTAEEYIEPDPYAATRRAIVRAAAEIGRAKP